MCSRLRFMPSRSFLLQIHNQEHEYLVQCSCERRRDWLINWKIINYLYIIRDSLRRYVYMCLCVQLTVLHDDTNVRNYTAIDWHTEFMIQLTVKQWFMIQLTVKQWFQNRKVNWHTVLTGVRGCTTLRSVCRCCHAIFCDRSSCSNYGMVPDRNTWTAALLCR